MHRGDNNRQLKVIAIDHVAVKESMRGLYAYLARFADIHLTLLVPEQWSENYSIITADKTTRIEHLRIITGTCLFKGRPHLMVYLNRIVGLLLDKPDIIYVNAEPENFLMIEVIALAKILCPQAKIVCVTWRNIQYRWNTFPYRLSPLHAIAEKMSFWLTDACRALIHDGHDKLREKGYTKSISVIPWGIDPDVFKRQETLRFKDKHKLQPVVVGYVGRLVKPKGIDILIRAVSLINHENTTVLLVGNGPEKEALQEQARLCGLAGNLVTIETIAYEDMPACLSSIDVLVLPSRTTQGWKEQFGRILIEAMACGVVVIGSTSGEIPRVIGEAGLVFEEGNADDLAHKLSTVLSDTCCRKTYQEKARKHATRNYSWQNIAHKMHALLVDTMSAYDSYD